MYVLINYIEGKAQLTERVIDGRRQYVDILDCYLQRNLVRNGGYLDEVHFLSHTDNQDDIDWLHDLVNKTSGYKYVPTKGHFGDMWKQHVSDADTMYIKIDDDIVCNSKPCDGIALS